MSKIEIRVLALENDGSSGVHDFRECCLELSRTRSVQCQFLSDGVALDGDTSAILDILQELDDCSFRIGARKRVVVSWKIEREQEKSPDQRKSVTSTNRAGINQT